MPRRVLVAIFVVATLIASACGSGSDEHAWTTDDPADGTTTTPGASLEGEAAVAPSVTATTAPPSSAGATGEGSGDTSSEGPPSTRIVVIPPPRPAAPPTSAPAPPPPPPPAPPFNSNIGGVGRENVPSSWREGCPVHFSDLRLVTVSHWGFDGALHDGQLVVHHDVAVAVVGIFYTLYNSRFPIERMQPVDVYGADDNASMAANNTSAFNCRSVTGQPGVWSEHSYGRAIDINPVQNPYVRGGTVLPPAGSAYLNRSSSAQGLIKAGGPAVVAFAAAGWGWGGNWSSIKDYQHFSASGR